MKNWFFFYYKGDLLSSEGIKNLKNNEYFRAIFSKFLRKKL